MRFLRYWAPLLVFSGFIFWLSSIPGDGLPLVPINVDFLPSWIAQHPDKIAHGILYAILGWLCIRALARGSTVPFPQAAILAFTMASIYAATDEWHQSFVPLRSCDLNDWIADVIGCFVAIASLYRAYGVPKKTVLKQPD